MRHKQAGGAGCGQGGGHGFARLDAQRGVKRRERFIEKDQRRLGGKRARERDALLLTAGKLLRRARRVSGRQTDKFQQFVNAIPGAPLPFVQSALLVWPQLSGMVAAMLLIFTGAYVTFQRQEVRA